MNDWVAIVVGAAWLAGVAAIGLTEVIWTR